MNCRTIGFVYPAVMMNVVVDCKIMAGLEGFPVAAVNNYTAVTDVVNIAILYAVESSVFNCNGI
jgi:hypothetical protein